MFNKKFLVYFGGWMVNKLIIWFVLKIEILVVKILVSKDLDFIKNLNIFLFF